MEKQLQAWALKETKGYYTKVPFHWTAIPLQFEILVKMTRIEAEAAIAQ